MPTFEAWKLSCCHTVALNRSMKQLSFCQRELFFFFNRLKLQTLNEQSSKEDIGKRLSFDRAVASTLLLALIRIRSPRRRTDTEGIPSPRRPASAARCSPKSACGVSTRMHGSDQGQIVSSRKAQRPWNDLYNHAEA